MIDVWSFGRLFNGKTFNIVIDVWRFVLSNFPHFVMVIAVSFLIIFHHYLELLKICNYMRSFLVKILSFFFFFPFFGFFACLDRNFDCFVLIFLPPPTQSPKSQRGHIFTCEISNIAIISMLLTNQNAYIFLGRQ